MSVNLFLLYHGWENDDKIKEYWRKIIVMQITLGTIERYAWPDLYKLYPYYI